MSRKKAATAVASSSRSKEKKASTKLSRRKFLGRAAAGAAGAATMGFPLFSVADTPINMRFQSTWPTKDIFHEYALDFGRIVNEMTGGRLKIEVLPAGAVVKAFDMIDAVHKGVLDGGHGVCAYWYGRNSAYSLFGTTAMCAMDSNQLLSWVEFGGGKDLYNELQHNVMNYDVQGFLYGAMTTQPLGWFKKIIKSPDDFKGMKYRTVGLAVDLMKEMGASVVALPGGEIIAAIDRGLIDAAEFNNASSDRALGFPDVSKICMLQSYHQACECFEILFNKKKYDALSTDLKAIISYAVKAASAELGWKAIDRYSKDYIGMQVEDKVHFYRTPKSVLEAQLEKWDKVIANKSQDNPFFAKVYDSQKKFAERVSKWAIDTTVPTDLAINHFFGSKA